MFERPQGGDKAILVHFTINTLPASDADEFVELVRSAGAEVLCLETGTRYKPDPKFFIGSGKAEEIHQLVKQHEADVVIFDHALSPAQERNLEKSFQCRVLDRTGLILDIFAQRARTFEGKLQVELAQLKHLSTRLVRGWTHLERQKGGIGLRGPGETQLETDRRLIGDRMKQINKRLEKVSKHRNLSRRARKKAEIPTISLVGYTNAGKSTLFNALTQSSVYAADQLFATLDPTIRRVEIGDAGPVILVDTVGFIRFLPHDLVAAFRATLEEAQESDLLLHVVDASCEEMSERIDDVNEVLKEIGAEDLPTLMIYNKIDAIERAQARLDYDDQGKPASVWLSARSGEGLDLLKEAFKQVFGEQFVHCWVKIPPSAGKFYASCHQLQAILGEKTENDGHLILELNIQHKTLTELLPPDSEIFENNPHVSGN